MTKSQSKPLSEIAPDAIEKKLTVKTPGSTSNLGPGFDTLGLALSVYTTITAVLLKEDRPDLPRISLTGPATASLPTDETNLVYAILCDVLHHKPAILRRLRIVIDSDIPLGRGLGSSAAAMLGALRLGRHLDGHDFDPGTLLSMGMRYEGHADNIAPCLLGGLIVCGPSKDNRSVITQKLPWPDQWQTTLVVPPYQVSTQEARLILPATISRADAVENVQRLGYLIAAVVNKDEATLKEALHDKLHEQYRAPLVPELESLRKFLKSSPALGCVMSGAGSSILVVHHERHGQQVNSELKEWAAKEPSRPQILNLKVDHGGMTFSG